MPHKEEEKYKVGDQPLLRVRITAIHKGNATVHTADGVVFVAPVETLGTDDDPPPQIPPGPPGD